ncbi:MAG: C13 family peptidase [Desulfococcaceae bacterium]|jgi:YVTN family beta-propeller protein|nr:C13 family peptidase [Desulfococcaceae bacterium]
MKKIRTSIVLLLIILCTLPAYANPVHETTVINGSYLLNMPFDIAVVPGTVLKGYVSSRQNGCVLVINLSDAIPYITSQINLPGTGTKEATAIAYNPAYQELYVLDRARNSLFVIHTDSDSIDSAAVTVSSSPQNVIVSPDGQKIYVCSAGSDEITVIQTATKTTETVISLGADADPLGMSIADNKLYVAGTWTGKVYVIDLNSTSPDYHSLVKTLSVGDKPCDAVSRADGSYVYISHNSSGGDKISVIDTSTDTVTTSVSLDSAKNPQGMKIVNGILYAVNYGDSTLTMLDTQTNTQLLPAQNIISGGNSPIHPDASPDGTKLYIVHSDPGSVEIINIEHPVQYSLNIINTGTCTGTVNAGTGGISCGSDCTEIYDWNSSVLLSASAESGCVFQGWSGGGCSGQEDCTVKMTENKNITATFEKTASYTLTVTTTGMNTGTVSSQPAGISCGIDCADTYPAGTTVTLSAAPQYGYRLKDWSGGGCEGSTSQCNVQVNQNTQVFVNFEKEPPRRLDVENTFKAMGTVTSDIGGIDCGEESCAALYEYGREVTLTAAASPGYAFTGWEGSTACSGSEKTCTLKLEEDITIKANFEITVTKNSKAIIVAGGGPFAGNHIWDQTKICGDFAFRTLLCHRYARDKIKYFTHDTAALVADCSNPPSKYRADGIPTKTELAKAIKEWAADADDLVLFLADHGGDNKFRLSGSEILYADEQGSEEDLKGYLDYLQTKTTMSGRVIVVYDACQSGSFISRIAAPPGKQRVVLTSASADQNAWFLSMGRLSFSYQFWSAVFGGAPLNEAFGLGRDMMADYQTCQADGNGDGVANENEAKLLSKIYIGFGYGGHGCSSPFINEGNENILLDGDISALIWAADITSEKEIKEVWAEILPPCYEFGDPEEPITDLTKIILQEPDNNGKYQIEYEGFTEQGTYIVNIYASIDCDSYSTVYSSPWKFTVEQTAGTPCAKCDVNGDTNTDLKDALILLQMLTSGNSPELASDALPDSDINRDEKLGMEEVIFILRKTAGLH